MPCLRETSVSLMRTNEGSKVECNRERFEKAKRARSVPVSQVSGNDHFRSHVFIRRWSQAATRGTTVSWDRRTY